MTDTRTIAFAALTGLATIGIAGNATAQTDLTEVCPNPMRMADTGVEGMRPLAQAFGPFQEVFQEKTGLELELYGLNNRTAAGNALQYDEVEMVFAGPAELLLMRREVEDGIDVLFGIERPYYGTTYVVRDGSGIETMADLEDKHVLMKDIGSTSGHLIPTKMLADAGLDPERDVDITMAGDAFIQAFANGDGDAMGGGNDDADELVDNVDPNGNYRVLAESGPLPGDPVVIRSEISQDCKTGLRNAMIENRDAFWEALVSTERNEEKFLNRGSELNFDFKISDYDEVKAAYDAAGIEL
ncbi:PhnD/SsuA/transferrin family substrate-binding protein [Spiribacter vilamensis]|uniref:Phosphonate transport system substrate-binding protein n=1 Tax=Spiribacter vilamensis TaxID=531306 RepID=A0A4Q8D121_9GAMM|nr:PhnD/SsuA/transferrin family substrate-binding protein [Spiribacter vilamensis]RZU99071.1 phosphonate transport system substrate-binding protein [Spiribacter vilamensis]TVO61931.1 PhnD/SsuA/transferrin family substrate-binding protein [Spiribacter vilamensis]